MSKSMGFTVLAALFFLPGAPLSAQVPMLLPPLSNATVNVPWSDLQHALERAAVSDRSQPPPVAYVFGSAQTICRVGAGTARAETAVEITLTGPDWTLVPLVPVDSGLLEVLADGQPCPLVVRDQRVHALLRKAGAHPLVVRMEVPVERSGEYRQATFALPAVPLAAVRGEIPSAAVLVELPRATALHVETQGEQTIAAGALAGGGTAVLRWRPRPAATAARLEASTENMVTLSDDALDLALSIELTASPALPAEVAIELPAACALLAVDGPRVAGWREAARDGRRMLLVQLDVADAPQAARLGLRLRTDGPLASGLLTLPLPRVADTRRAHGWIALGAADGLVLQHAATSGVTRIGVDELPAGLRIRTQLPAQLAYACTQPPATLAVQVDRPARETPIVRAEVLTLARVESDRLLCQAEIRYSLARGGLLALRLGLPPGADLLAVTGEGLRAQSVTQEAGRRVLNVDLSATAREQVALNVRYACVTPAGTNAVDVPLLEALDASATHGVLGIEVGSGSAITPLASGAARIDATELPRSLWGAAAAPPVLAFRYDGSDARISLQIGRQQQAPVLVAMSDVCEAATTMAPDGKTITKLMYVLRNSQKTYMRLTLPAGAEVWSTFVADRPVTPIMNGPHELIIPLRRSKPIDPDDEQDGATYAARRDRRRRGALQQELLQAAQQLAASDDDVAAADLKPYDVEVVFVGPSAKLVARGQITLALPASDIPTGLLAWEILLPQGLRIYDDATGNCTAVSGFSLPFTHFAEEQRGLARAAADMAKQAQAQEKAMAAQEAVADALAADAKAAGVLPVRIETPVAGIPQRFEKLLVVDEAPTVTLPYKRR